MGLLLYPSDVVALVCTTLSGVACSWLIGLLTWRRIFFSERLIFWQLLSLAVFDFLWVVINIPSLFAATVWTDAVCTAFILTHSSLDFAICLLDVQIALGFAAACYGSTKLTKFLKALLFFSWPLGLLLTIVIQSSLATVLPHQLGELTCRVVSQLRWDIIVCVSFSMTAATYACCMYKTLATPGVVARRSLYRTLAYMLVFLLTLVLDAIGDLGGWQYGFPSSLFREASWCLICLAGAANVMCVVDFRPWSFHVAFRSPDSFVGMPSGQWSREEVAEYYFDFHTEVGSRSLLQSRQQLGELQQTIAVA
eukprot:TRINITY_DN45907_c0_g1_i1.p1 TRINITY_DN45907_c0_g1~~TRINITY_DN45907_c0_g1_i1.p1  ORF type:complete len:309 (+),score=26.81 TRINITY_DN45907_c0_g1_i1:134-1060(+)